MYQVSTVAPPAPAPAPAPLGAPVTTTHHVISYTYDSLYRLITATYSTGEYYQYAYDPVGNRLSLTTTAGVVNYQYDAANRMEMAGDVPVGWDDNGNMTSFGSRSYTYDHANRLTSVTSGTLTTQFSYDGLGNRTATTVDGVTTRYVLDVAGGLPEVIVATTGGASTQYLQVAGQILAQYDSGTWGYILPDHLGSVRAETDTLGQVTVVRNFDPFGVPLQADGGSPFGYTGEWWDSQAELLYLRARYYDPGVGRFTQGDPWRGDIQEPQTFHVFVYAQNNPVNLTDRSGLSPRVDCTNWPTYLGLQKLCQQANGDDNNPDVLDARERIYERIVIGGYVWGSVGGPGYGWAAAMLNRFLHGGGSELSITRAERPLDSFFQDPGIARAIRGLRNPKTGIATTASFCKTRIAGDEPDCITPLLWAFLQERIQPVAESGKFSVKRASLKGADYYSDQEPRSYDTGFWAAFGHVCIDGDFSAEGRQSCRPEGYVIRYRADYRIEDNYRWFEGKKTPFNFPGSSATVWIPHEWAISLTRAAPPRANNYKFTISWTESERILVGSDFSWYRPMAWWEPAF